MSVKRFFRYEVSKTRLCLKASLRQVRDESLKPSCAFLMIFALSL